MAVGTYGLPRVVRCRLTAAKVRIMGAAEGTIIPTIIAAHIRNVSSRSVGVHSCVIGIISINVSQTMIGQKQIDRIRAEQLAMSAAYTSIDKANVGNFTTTIVAVNMDNRTYTASAFLGVAGSGISGTRLLSTTISY